MSPPEAPRLILLQNGDLLAPEPQGKQSVLLAGDKIARVGEVDPRGAEALGLPLEIVDASGCWVTPGFVDPHVHLTGGSGEEGFSSRTPEIQFTELVAWGTTTAVGCLGVDATTRTPTALLAKVKGLNEEGMTAFLYTGYYGIPPSTFTGSVRNDLMIVQEVIGLGEVAVSDHRAPQPEPRELARLVVDAHVGGMLSGKAGVTHFHLGELPERLAPVRALLDEYHIAPGCLYPSHVHRTPELLDEALDLAKRGCYVDMDCAQEDATRWVRIYFEKGGDPSRLTLSSDGDSSGPKNLYLQIRKGVQEYGVPFERLIPLATANPAKALRLEGKGRIEPGRDADLLVLRKDSLEIESVIARGKWMVRGGEVVARESFLAKSNRDLSFLGGRQT